MASETPATPLDTRLARVKGLLVDLDGVVYLGDQLISGAPEFFRVLREREVAFLLVTNNSSRTTQQFAEKLCNMGILVSPSEVLTSAEATATFLAGRAPAASRVYVIGEIGLREALTRQGFRLDGPPYDYVVVGLDREFDYAKLTTAITAIRHGATLVGANPDATLPTDAGEMPGAGSLLAAVAAGGGVEPLVIGKPEPTMFLQGARLLGLEPAEVAALGDRLDTDVVGAKRAGLVAILVLTGITRRADLERSTAIPDLVVDDLPSFVRKLLAARS
jgi:4-nitrophenyl phosphatase